MKKYSTPTECIQSVLDQRPIVSYKTTEEEIRETANIATKLLVKQFGQLFDITERIETADFKPPFSLSWDLKEKNGKSGTESTKGTRKRPSTKLS